MSDDPWSVGYTGPHPEEPDQKSLDEYWERADEEEYWRLRYEMMEYGEGSDGNAPVTRKIKWGHVWHGDGTWSITQEPVLDSKKDAHEEITKTKEGGGLSRQEPQVYKNGKLIKSSSPQRDISLGGDDAGLVEKEESGELFYIFVYGFVPLVIGVFLVWLVLS